MIIYTASKHNNFSAADEFMRTPIKTTTTTPKKHKIQRPKLSKISKVKTVVASTPKSKKKITKNNIKFLKSIGLKVKKHIN